jgi:Integrase core domain
MTAISCDCGPGSPCRNGYIESFNGKRRGELLNLEFVTKMIAARVLRKCWRRHYNQLFLHSSSGFRPPPPESILRCFRYAPAGPSLDSASGNTRPKTGNVYGGRSTFLTQ